MRLPALARLIPTLSILACSAPADTGESEASSGGGDGTSVGTGATTTASSTGTADSGTTGDATVIGLGPGPHAVGHASAPLQLGDGRTATVEFWYPAAEGSSGEPDSLVDFEPAGERHDALAPLVTDAPEPCTRKQSASLRDAAAAPGPWPTVVFSHCSNCLRISGLSLAERLASWGFVVAAPDHEGNTLYDWLANTSVGVSAEFLPVRGADVVAVIDALAADDAALPASVRGLADTARLGVMGHSFGSVTTGFVAQSDARVQAAVAIAAPVENPVLPGVAVADIHVPLLMLLAQEDHSILEIGNSLIRSNFADANSPAWLVEFVDAGHWSFSDICALTEDFTPGCGEDTRQVEPHEPFSYVDIEATRARGADWVAVFFAAHLLDDAAAQQWLAEAASDDAIAVQSH
ncbi:MAG: dienelactone hydrolase family protein [Nannocystaceae bacterium]|nr:dienelactone hydrolase family protein [Nannocystaceae bacterium]